MNYYVRKTDESEIEGPFIVEQINEMVRKRQLAFDSLAISDNGEKVQDILKGSKKLWQKLADIPGFEPHPQDEKRCLTIMFGLLIIFVIAVIIGLIKLSKILHGIQ